MPHRSGWIHWPMTRPSCVCTRGTLSQAMRRPVAGTPRKVPVWVPSARLRIATASLPSITSGAELKIAERGQDVPGVVLQRDLEAGGLARQAEAVFGVAFEIDN